MSKGKLQIIPIGGLGEFGMNCMAIRWDEDIFVIDAGLMFPESDLLGVDIVVPDITYLIENRSRIRGIVLTHGHEDHIGGLPWLLRELNVQVHETEFTLAYVEGKLEEHKLLDNAELIEIEPKRKFHLGPFTIEPLRVTHSLVDCVALAIETPVGIIIHTGDFKVDLSPPDGRAFDLASFAEYGKRGVLALLQDSTNVDPHKHAKIERGDTVVLSSRVIPGNEKSIYRVIDHLCRREANVIFDDGQSGLIHVSGHGSQEELRLMINLVRPKFFIPVHGDFRHLQRHARLAMDIGISENAYLLEDGDVLELDQKSAVKNGKVT